MRFLNWFYLALMSALIWGIVLLHEKPHDTLIIPSSVSVLHSSQETPPNSESALWTPHSKTSITLPDDALWLKFTFPLNEKGRYVNNAATHNAPNELAPAKGLFVSLLGAYFVYLNGTLIGNNGQPASKGFPERAGNIDSVFLLPTHLIKHGENTVLLRVSSQFRSSNHPYSGLWVLVDNYARLITINEARIRLPIMMLSALFLIALYAFIVYFSSLKDPTYLWFSGLSMTLVLLIVAESWRGLFGYQYQWHIVRMEVILWITALISLLLPMFFVAFFRLSTQLSQACFVSLIVLYAMLIIFVDGYDYRSFVLFSTGIAVSFLIGIVCIVIKKQHAWLMTMGIVVLVSPILLNRYSFMDQYFFVSFSCLALMMLLVLSQTHAERQKALVLSELTTHRLELELVKKQLQPHFILNTLTAIEEWIDTAPKEAVRFIQALALEFRQMAQLSRQSLVTFEQELALCESHLTIMGYRFDATFTLRTQGINMQQRLPPGVLLTLIENAFSHNKYGSNSYVFSLHTLETENAENERTKNNIAAIKWPNLDGDTIRLVFKAQRGNGIPIDNIIASKEASTGVGTKYIKARLTEAYGDNWYFDEYAEENHWVAILSFPNHSPEGGKLERQPKGNAS